MNSLTFNGERIDGVNVISKDRPYWAPRTPEIREVPGVPGGYLEDVKTGVTVINVVLDIYTESPLALRRRAEQVAAWLKTKQPAPLVFDDEPDRTYFAIAAGNLDPDEYVSFGSLPITFMCPDPYKYGYEQSAPLNQDVIEIENNGTETARPVFKGIATGSITHLDFVTEGAYMRIGAPAPIDAAPPPTRRTLFSSELTTTNGWSAGTIADGGTVRGSMISDGNAFIASDFGVPFQPYGYQGPALNRTFGTPAQHFQVSARIEQMNSIAGVGIVEILLLNAANQIIAVLAFEDVFNAARINRARMSLGTGSKRREIIRQADSPPSWSDFDGIFQIERIGSHWTAYFAKVRANGEHHTRANFSFWDYGDDYMDELAKVQLSIRKWGDPNTPATAMKIKNLNAYGYDFSTDNGPAYIAHAGDEIEINHETGLIAINGKEQIWLKDLGASFFELQPGKNYITTNPHYAVDMDVFWRERFV